MADGPAAAPGGGDEGKKGRPEETQPTIPDHNPVAGDTDPSQPTIPAVDDTELEDIVAEFILSREEGEDPLIDDYLAKYPRHAEELAMLLSSETVPLPPPDDLEREMSGEGRPEKVGPWEILEHVSTAGGGVVWRARHERSRQVVALKVLDALTVRDPRDFDRFRQEARLLQSMELVSVVPVLDAGEDRGRHYIATRWIEGETLAALRESLADTEHRMHAPEERARLVARLARAFGAIHAQGVLHRDIKPGNILVDRLGEPAIIDFGIASDPSVTDMTMTSDGPMGTPRYLPPELLSEGNAGFSTRSEVYCLGLCLYELSTGVRAFVQTSRDTLFTQIRRNGPLRPRAVAPGLSRDLEAIILRATEIDPDRRYQVMEALASDLERFARGEAPEPATLKGARTLPRFVRRHPVGAAASVLLLVLAVVGATVGPGLYREWRSEVLDEDQAARDRAAEAQLAAARATVEGLRFAPSEILPADVTRVEADALALQSRFAEEPELRFGAAWALHLTGAYEAALFALGREASATDRGTEALFRAWLELLNATVKKAEAQAQRGGIGTRPGHESVDGRGKDDRFEIKENSIVRVDLSASERLARRRLLPPTLEQVREIIADHGSVDPDADELYLRGYMRWRILPSDVDVGKQGARRLADEVVPVRAELEDAVKAEAEHPWGHYLLAQLTLRYEDVEDALRHLEGFHGSGAETASSRYLEGIALSRTKKSAEAAAAFRRAGALAEGSSLSRVRLAGWWALAELARPEPAGVREAMAQWREHLGDAWIEGAFLSVCGARLALREEKPEEALKLLEKAARANPDYALPFKLQAVIYETDLDDERKARQLFRHADTRPQQWPLDLEAWLTSSYFGLRPHSTSSVFGLGAAGEFRDDR